MSRRTRRHPIAQSACIRAAPSAWFAGERRYHWQTVVSRSARRRRRADLCPVSRTSWAAKHRPVAVQREAHPQRLPVHFFVFVHRQTSGLRSCEIIQIPVRHRMNLARLSFSALLSGLKARALLPAFRPDLVVDVGALPLLSSFFPRPLSFWPTPAWSASLAGSTAGYCR